MRMPATTSDTALLIVDVQRDFCAPDGAMANYGVDLSTIDPAVKIIDKLAKAARKAQVTVIFIRLTTQPETDSPAMLAWYARQGIDESAAAVCRLGHIGSDYYRIYPERGDLVVHKQRYSAFVGTNLELMLKSRGIRHLVVTGVTTECCVESTVRDGFMKDYETFVVEDGCAAYEKELHEMSLKSMALNFSTVVQSEEALTAWLAVEGVVEA